MKNDEKGITLEEFLENERKKETERMIPVFMEMADIKLENNENSSEGLARFEVRAISALEALRQD